MSEKISLVLSGGLAGAAALAATSGAYAAIVPAASLPALTPTGAAGTTNATFWDVDGDAVNDMAMLVSNAAGPFTGTTWASQVAMLGNTAVAYAGPYGGIYAYNLAAGVDVASQSFNAGLGTYGQIILASLYQNAALYGQFTAASVGETGFLGFSFSIGANTHYGFALVRSTMGVSLEVLAACYNDTPGASLLTGATHIPAPGTLAGLAFGAVAFSRRNRKNRAA